MTSFVVTALTYINIHNDSRIEPLWSSLKPPACLCSITGTALICINSSQGVVDRKNVGAGCEWGLDLGEFCIEFGGRAYLFYIFRLKPVNPIPSLNRTTLITQAQCNFLF